MCIRDRSNIYQIMGKEINETPQSLSDNSTTATDVHSPIRKRHRRLTVAEKEKLFDMIIFKRYKMKEMAEMMGVHYLTVKNFIRRRRKEYFANGGDWNETKECLLMEIPRNKPAPVIKIESTVGGLRVNEYACRVEQKINAQTVFQRCEYKEKDPNSHDTENIISYSSVMKMGYNCHKITSTQFCSREFVSIYLFVHSLSLNVETCALAIFARQ
eukprot:TRINITY_DN12028_c0_g4_i1.p1 TRINITY_DN12028_c0_g4~~TRINITY_DN12028_c0_g4_i1.p1  ORF type:complete len:214 (+),score=11.72 TRINITY_DN12028_c0_g4_i1:66-707(+)